MWKIEKKLPTLHIRWKTAVKYMLTPRAALSYKPEKSAATSYLINKYATVGHKNVHKHKYLFQ